MASPLLLSKYVGCLIGAAIGDALATPFAGLTTEQIRHSGLAGEFGAARAARSFLVPIGELGVAEAGDLLEPGQWTEDVQLMLALADALLEENGAFIPEAWAHGLVRWLNGEPRSPGVSTVQAAIQLRTSGVLWDEAADPEGGGSGPAARVAPVALLYGARAASRLDAAVTQAQVTHGAPEAQAGAVAMAEAIALLLPQGASDLERWDGAAFLAEVAERVTAAAPEFAGFGRCLEVARVLLEDGVEFETAVRVIGTSGWSREAVPCALYCLAHDPRDFEALLNRAVGQTAGASETVACMVGALAGALLGVEAIPTWWRAGVEDFPRISATARALHALAARQQPPL